MTPSFRNFLAKISTLVSDVDGALITDDKILTMRALAAVAKLHAGDIEFVIISGLSIAMGNAGPVVQGAANFVTDSNHDDGFANAVEGFILSNNRSNAQVASAHAAGSE